MIGRARRVDASRRFGGVRHWEIFTGLCRQLYARGNTAPDAFLAAIAIEQGSTWVSADRGFAGYPGLRWMDPLGS